MKLKISDKVYLQRFDVKHILHNSNSCPISVVNETFGIENDAIFVTNFIAAVRFDYIYNEPTNIRWLMDQDWILDYDEYVKMPLAELETLRGRLKAAYSVSVREFNSRDKIYRRAHFEEKRDEFGRLNHKIASLSCLIGFLKGKIDFIFPDEYQDKNTDWRS